MYCTIYKANIKCNTMIILLVVVRGREKPTLVRMQKQTNLDLKCDHNKQFTHPFPFTNTHTHITTPSSNRIVELSFLLTLVKRIYCPLICATRPCLHWLTHTKTTFIIFLFCALFPSIKRNRLLILSSNQSLSLSH